jgi:drug/metabolite transporter (DMT)-like permease
VLSVFLFAEIPTPMQWLGFVLAVGAIILINYEKGTSFSGVRLPLVLMLLSGGCGDAMSKVFEVYGSPSQGDLFLFYTFVSAFLLCIGLILRKGERPDRYALIFGVVVGFPYFFSAKFLLMALERLPAVIVYPTYSVATILAVTLAGIFLFKERLRRLQWVALTVILAALVLLNR